MKRTDDLRKYWDAIKPWSPDVDERSKWQEVRLHGASRIEVLKNDPHQHRVISVLLGQVMPSPGDNVLDFGCGVGRISRQLSLMGCTVKAVDISPKIIAYARDYCHDVQNIEFIIGDGHSCGDAPDGWADLVVSAFVFQHMPSRQVVCDCLDDFYRVLKPERRVCIQSRHDGFTKGTEKAGLLGVRLSAGELANLAAEAGFNVMQVDETYGNPDMKFYRIILQK